MNNNFNRRKFIQTSVIAGTGLAFSNRSFSANISAHSPVGKRIGIIGLDTSHCIAFTKTLNDPGAAPEFDGYKVVAAFPTSGSNDLPASINRLSGFTEQVRQQGVEIVSSIEELLEKIDVVLLETVDGRKHLEQALPVIKAGRRMFIDKPVAASLADAVTIFDTAKQFDVPVFSSSSVRYITGASEITEGKLGRVLGAETYGPADIEKTHPDLFWYGIHGIELLFAMMGPQCKNVVRVHANDTDMLVGTWSDGRIGSYRGIRSGKKEFGGTVFGETGNKVFGEFNGYDPLLKEIIKFFRTGIAPVSPEETLAIVAFMEAADESKAEGGIPVDLQTIMERVRKK